MTWIIITLFFIAAGSLIVYQLRTGVPPFPATKKEIGSILTLLGQTDFSPRSVIYELGCGWGGVLVALSKAFPDARIVGEEISFIPYLVARWRTRKLSNVIVKWVDFNDDSLVDADAVVCYLMIAPMVPLAEKLDRELEEDTPVVSLSFLFRDRLPDKVIRGSGLLFADAALYRWSRKA